MIWSSLQCLESTEGGQSDSELADCYFQRQKVLFSLQIFSSLSEQIIGVNCCVSMAVFADEMHLK